MGIFSPEQSGSLTQTSTTGPPDWLSALYQQGTGAAQNYFQGYQSNPLTQQGLGFMGGLSQDPNQYGYQPVLDEFQKTVGGDYLHGGPGFDAYMQAAQNKIQPAVQSAFNSGGRLNSGLAQTAMTQAMSDSFANLYNQERNRQQGALSMAPQMAQFAASPGVLAYDTGQLSDAEYETQLDDFLRRLTGVGSTYSKTESSQPLFENSLLDLLGGASTVAGLADTIFGSGSTGDFLKSLFGGGSDASFNNAVSPEVLNGDTGGGLPPTPPGLSNAITGSLPGAAGGFAGFAPGIGAALGSGIGTGAIPGAIGSTVGLGSGAGSFGAFAPGIGGALESLGAGSTVGAAAGATPAAGGLSGFGSIGALAPGAGILAAMYGINQIQAGAKDHPISKARDRAGQAAMSGTSIQLDDGSFVTLLPDFANRSHGFLIAGRNDGAYAAPTAEGGLRLVVPGGGNQGGDARLNYEIEQYLAANAGNNFQPSSTGSRFYNDDGEVKFGGITQDRDILMSAARAGLLPRDPWGNADDGGE